VDTRYRLKLSDKQREQIHHSFKLLLKYQDAVTEYSGIKRFELEFFPKFFAINPGAQRLFHKKNLEQQSKAFVRMLFWIIENIESRDLSTVIVQLGTLAWLFCNALFFFSFFFPVNYLFV
jgi:hypothetical protein